MKNHLKSCKMIFFIGVNVIFTGCVFADSLAPYVYY